MIGADLLVRELQARGVPFVSVLCGNGLGAFLKAAAEAELRLIDTRNEQAASYIADAYARLTRRVGVCAVSSGVAHVNAFAGLLNASYDGAPALLITGASSSANLGRGAFQDLDQVALAQPLCKRAELVTKPERIPQAVHEAFAAATSGRPGPVHLTIPADVLSGEIDEAQIKSPFSTFGEVKNRAAGDASLVRDAAKMLADAKRPVIVAGSGVFYAEGGAALERFVKLSRIPVVTPIWDRGVVNRSIEEFLGVIGAASGEPKLLEDADLLLLAGARVDYRVRYLDSPPLSEGIRVIRLDFDPGELSQGFEPDVAIQGSAQTIFQQLEEEWRSNCYDSHESWLSEARKSHADFHSRWAKPAPSAESMTGADIVNAIKTVITDETIFLIDGGNIGQWAHIVLCSDRYPSNWITCGASGVVGWGVPGAMAARLAFPDKPVLLLSGDGAIAFGIPEFESAARQNIPFVTVLADDQAWGIVVSGQLKSRGPIVASKFSPVQFAKVAEGFGARGVMIEKPEEIAPAIREGFESSKPTLIHVPITVGGPAD
ncbi:TPA: thiamine pyrophosphate-binding protein [Candidatus Poribacteria bacterium]|nr:thiamine pyrophosphate-binding protein [Candidatus Poribacteria bacterium]